MLCILEILCLVYGIITLAKGKFPVGKTREVRGAPAYFIGVILLSIIPVGIGAFIVLNWDDLAQGQQPDPFKFDAKTILPDVIAVFGCGGLAMLIAFMNAKPKEDDRRSRRRDYDDEFDERPRRRRDLDDAHDDDPPRRRRDVDDYDDRRRRRDDFDERAR
jgi:hypothetical protein